jgi:hypothetical protein
MKKLFVSLVLLFALLLLGLPGATIMPAAASSLDPNAVLSVNDHYHNPPHHSVSPAAKGPQTATLQTVPSIPGITFQVAGQQFVTGADGSAVVVVPQPGTYDLQVITDTFHDPYRRVEFSRWLSESFQPTRQIHFPTQNPVVQVGINVYELVGEKFVDPNGAPVNPQRVTQFSIRSLQGDAFTFKDGQPRWIPASRVTRRRSGGLDPVNLLYTVSEVMVDGSNVVNKAQQQFYAQPNATWSISLLFYTFSIHTTDALFGFPQGKQLNLYLPNGEMKTYPLDSTGSVSIPSLARGDYFFQVTGARGISPKAPVSLSKDQELNTKVISFLDMGVIGGAGMLIALGLILYGKFSLKRAVARNDRARQARYSES